MQIYGLNREAGGGLTVYVCDIIPCIKELIICKDVLPLVLF
jgi:hypothetical protein